jgi:hypothetical protein
MRRPGRFRQVLRLAWQETTLMSLLRRRDRAMIYDRGFEDPAATLWMTMLIDPEPALRGNRDHGRPQRVRERAHETCATRIRNGGETRERSGAAQGGVTRVRRPFRD